MRWFAGSSVVLCAATLACAPEPQEKIAMCAPEMCADVSDEEVALCLLKRVQTGERGYAQLGLCNGGEGPSGTTHMLLRANGIITYVDEIYDYNSDSVNPETPEIRVIDVEIDQELVQQRIDECDVAVEQYGGPCSPCDALNVGDEHSGRELSCTP
ncbi:MAG: hypothetical protein H6713_38345 [Myxococcales bacterium]|nr:hypothetical protein [Myxococcales bacterium]